MKIADFKGEWVGLARWGECSYRLDHLSSPDDLVFGFEVVYRLIFHTEDTRMIQMFRDAFRDTFGLTKGHYDLGQEPKPDNIVYWRVYWDREGFELGLLKQLEEKLDYIAETNRTRVIILEMAIIPRSIDIISQEIIANEK